MILAFIFPHFCMKGGIERIWAQKMNLLAEQADYDVYFITYNQGNHPMQFQLSDKIHHVDLDTRYPARCKYWGWNQYWDRYKGYKEAVRTISRYLEQLNPDIVTCTDSRTCEIEAVAKARIKGKKVVEFHLGYALQHITLNEFSGFSLMRERTMVKRRMRWVKHMDCAVCITTADQQAARRRSICIPNMLFDYPAETADNTQVKHRVIAVGRACYQKGFDLLLDAWSRVAAKHPDWELDIYAPDHERLISQYHADKVPHVNVHAPVDNIYDKYRESDIFVLSSRYESFGLVLIEAMSCALPCISFDCPLGPGSIITHQQDGLLVENGNPEALAASLNHLIENQDERQQLGAAARQRAADFLPQNIMPKWDMFYKACSTESPERTT